MMMMIKPIHIPGVNCSNNVSAVFVHILVHIT
jgi:hypothetical protein